MCRLVDVSYQILSTHEPFKALWLLYVLPNFTHENPIFRTHSALLHFVLFPSKVTLLAYKELTDWFLNRDAM